MRIVGGRFRGRGLIPPRTQAVRPTSDRLRETIFDILDHAYGNAAEGARVIDLFAGTGALGLEALSRGAASALFVDMGTEALSVLKANVEALGVAGVARVVRRDATRLGVAPSPPFTLAFLDPPYGRNLLVPALDRLSRGGWLAPGTLCVAEEAAGAPVVLAPPFVELDHRTVGDTALRICRYEPVE